MPSTAESYVEKPKTLAALRAGLVSGATKATDLAASYYDRIAAVNPRLNIYLSLTKERALAQAAHIDVWLPRAIRCPLWPAFRWALRTCW